MSCHNLIIRLQCRFYSRIYDSINVTTNRIIIIADRCYYKASLFICPLLRHFYILLSKPDYLFTQ